MNGKDAGVPEPIVNAMTVDVEDYFHASVFDRAVPRSTWTDLESRVVPNTERLLQILNEANVRATFFVLGWVAERFPGLVRRIAESRHEVASHGFEHRLIYDQTPAAFREDIRRARHAIEDAAGVQVFGYRAPSFSVTTRSLWALDILCEEGYRYDASIFPVRHHRYGIPDAPRHPYFIEHHGRRLLEVPGSTVRLGSINLPVAGGGYFRLLPYAWTRWGIGRLNRLERRPAVFYLHPWEIDPDQPRVRVRFLSRVRHYSNLAKTESRLRRLLRDFSFGPLGEVLGRVELAVSTGVPSAALPVANLW